MPKQASKKADGARDRANLDPADESRAVPARIKRDQKLIADCLGGEIGAWSALYRELHGSLLSGIRAFLGQAGRDSNLVEEIAARVWYSLVKNNFDLLSKFSPKHGCRLSTFLSAVARNEARMLLRSERCRKGHEQVASKQEFEQSWKNNDASRISNEEFLVTLSPAERAFYCDVLLVSEEQGKAAGYSQENEWQLRHRIRKKLERFISGA